MEERKPVTRSEVYLDDILKSIKRLEEQIKELIEVMKGEKENE